MYESVEADNDRLRGTLETATEFLVAKDTFIRKAVQRDGQTKWKVVRHGAVLAKDGEWEVEPSPSSRDDDFLERTRYETFEAAKQALAAKEPIPYPNAIHDAINSDDHACMEGANDRARLAAKEKTCGTRNVQRRR